MFGEVSKIICTRNFGVIFLTAAIDDLDLLKDMRHEVLCYLQLLETNKPYIVNLLRVPGMILSI